MSILALTKSVGTELDNKTLFQVMEFAGRVGVVTPLQIAVHAFKGDEAKAQSMLERITFQHRLLEKKENLKIPQRCGTGKVTIYYLNSSGRKWLQEKDSDFHRFSAALQTKKIFEKHYLFHDLMINKALLWLEKKYEILGFIPERILRRNLFLARLQKTKSSDEEKPATDTSSDSMGDFRVLLKAPREQKPRWVECEVSISLDAEQIAKKPDDLVWFVHGETDADVVRAVKGEKAKYVAALGDLNSADYPMEVWRKKREEIKKMIPAGVLPVKSSGQKLLEALHLLGGVGEASALAAILNLDRSGVSRTLKEMENCRWIMSQTVSLTPGKKIGVPRKLYVLPEFDYLSLEERQRCSVISICVTEICRENYWFQGYETEGEVIRFDSSKDIFIPSVFVLIDNSSLTIEEIENRFNGIRELYPEDKIAVQVWEPERMCLFKNSFLAEHQINFLKRKEE